MVSMNKPSSYLVAFFFHSGVSQITASWGQFLAHECILTQPHTTNTSDTVNVMSIPVPTGDEHFDSLATGTRSLPFKRTAYDTSTGTSSSNPRRQINAQTGWIDGSVVYGTSASRLAALRAFHKGLLLEDSVNGVPPNTRCAPMAGHFGNDCQQRLTGDPRGSVAPGILALQGLFVLLHNDYARKFSSANPQWSDERIFQEARKRVVAHLQAIAFNEYAPVLLGEPLPPYQAFNASIDARIDPRFAAAAYRYGHSGVPSIFFVVDSDGRPHSAGHLLLRDHYFNPSYLDAGITIADLLRGMVLQREDAIDTTIREDMRSHLEGIMADIAFLDIMRGRDFGLPTYSQARQELGLPVPTSYADICTDVRVQAALEAGYGPAPGGVATVDLWVGILAESGSVSTFIGPTAKAIIADQFQRLRDGDRFYYENKALLNPDGSRYFDDDEIASIRSTKLSDIIARVTDWSKPPRSVFTTTGIFSPAIAGISPSPQPSASPAPAATGGGGSGSGAASTKSAALGSMITVDWTVPAAGATSITLKFTFKSTSGWFGIGLGASGMIGADVLMMKYSGGKAEVVDAKATSYATPATDSQQDWTVVSSSQSGGNTVITVSRALNTGDSNDAAITSGNMAVLSAWDTSSSAYGYHGQNRWMGNVNFLSA
jgi:Animal haem peroxidase/DOMON domain